MNADVVLVLILWSPLRSWLSIKVLPCFVIRIWSCWLLMILTYLNSQMLIVKTACNKGRWIYFTTLKPSLNYYYYYNYLPSDQAPQSMQQNTENGCGASEGQGKHNECNGTPLLSESALQEVRDDLQLHLNLSALLTLPVMLSAPSLIHWSRNFR